MAKQGYQAWTDGHNGPDPKVAGRHYDENNEAYRDLNDGDSNIGDGLRGGNQFADSDVNSGYSKKFLSQVNVIDSPAVEYVGSEGGPQYERTPVDASRAERGKEA